MEWNSSGLLVFLNPKMLSATFELQLCITTSLKKPKQMTCMSWKINHIYSHTFISGTVSFHSELFEVLHLHDVGISNVSQMLLQWCSTSLWGTVHVIITFLSFQIENIKIINSRIIHLGETLYITTETIFEQHYIVIYRLDKSSCKIIIFFIPSIVEILWQQPDIP